MIGNLGMKQVMSFQKNWGATYFVKTTTLANFVPRWCCCGCSKMIFAHNNNFFLTIIEGQQTFTESTWILIARRKKSSRLGCQLVGNVYSKSWFSTLFCPFSLVFPFNNFSTASRRRRKSQILPSWTSIASGRQMATHLSRLHHHHLSFQFGQTTRLWLQSIFVGEVQ